MDGAEVGDRGLELVRDRRNEVRSHAREVGAGEAGLDAEEEARDQDHGHHAGQHQRAPRAHFGGGERLVTLRSCERLPQHQRQVLRRIDGHEQRIEERERKFARRERDTCLFARRRALDGAAGGIGDGEARALRSVDPGDLGGERPEVVAPHPGHVHDEPEHADRPLTQGVVRTTPPRRPDR